MNPRILVALMPTLLLLPPAGADSSNSIADPAGDVTIVGSPVAALCDDPSVDLTSVLLETDGSVFRASFTFVDPAETAHCTTPLGRHDLERTSKVLDVDLADRAADRELWLFYSFGNDEAFIEVWDGNVLWQSYPVPTFAGNTLTLETSVVPAWAYDFESEEFVAADYRGLSFEGGIVRASSQGLVTFHDRVATGPVQL